MSSDRNPLSWALGDAFSLNDSVSERCERTVDFLLNRDDIRITGGEEAAVIRYSEVRKSQRRYREMYDLLTSERFKIRWHLSMPRQKAVEVCEMQSQSYQSLHFWANEGPSPLKNEGQRIVERMKFVVESVSMKRNG